jgi:histidyl-tRNA synthetase
MHSILDVAERRLDRKLRGASRAGARVAVIVGENEVGSDSAVVRDLDGRSQQTVPIAELASTVIRILARDSVAETAIGEDS